MYTAPTSGQFTLTYEAVNPADTWHHYAFSNEVVLPIYLDPSPASGGEIIPDAQLSWTLAGDMTDPHYHLRVATDAGLTQLVIDQTNLTATTYPLNLNYDQDYYWQVKVIEEGVVVYTSPTWMFITSSAPVAAVKVLEWKFEETAGTVAGQTGPSNGADGRLVGFNDSDSPQVRVTGISGKGIALNGTDEYIDVSSAQFYMPTGDGQSFSISGYLRTYDDYGPLFSMRNSANENPIIDITLGADGVQILPGRVCLLVRDDAGSLSFVNSGITVNDGRWHNFIVTRVDDMWTLYIDGVSRATINSAATGDVTLDLLALGTSLRWIADNWQPQNNHFRDFQGILDEYTVWDGELLPQQIGSLVAIVPSQGDINFDLDIDVNDLTDLAGNWLANLWTPIQSTFILEDMETYTSDPASFGTHWPYTPEAEFGDLALSVQPDPDGLHGQVMRMDYDFSTGGLHAYVPVRLPHRGADMRLFDHVNIRIKKLPGCDISKIILDFYDGRGNSNPSSGELYEKGRIEIPIDGLAVNQWETVTSLLPGPGSALRRCTDLYQVVFSIEDGGADTGTLLIDSFELTDSNEDCVLLISENLLDWNGDCVIDLSDFAELTGGWTNNP